MSELKFNQLTIQDGHIFLNGTEIECVKEFNLKSSTDGTAELSLKTIVDLTSMRLRQHGKKCKGVRKMSNIKPFDAEPIKMEPATKQDSIFIKIPIKCVHYISSENEKILRKAENDGLVNIAALQAKIQEAANEGAFDIRL
ncbi:MAG: hypothetical protein ACFWUC_02150 [Oscillospiraceae bacterium]